MTERLRQEIERLSEGRTLDDIAQALGNLHTHFVTPDRPMEEGPAYLRDKLSLAAYLAWFFPASAAQVERALNEVDPPPSELLRVLDVGAGPGPASAGVASWAKTHGRRVSLTALERAPEALDSLSRIWPFGDKPETRRWTAGEPLPDGPFDVIVISHVLNELFDTSHERIDRRTALCHALAERLSPGGLLVLVEPALKRTGRELLEVRDRLLESRALSVLAPCLMQQPCPALDRPRDWCHADRPWAPPDWSLGIGERAGLGRESLKFAYVILTNTPVPTPDDTLFRIVSEPTPEKGKKRLFGCGPRGRHALVRLDRMKSIGSVTFDELERGDVVELFPLRESGDGLRLTLETEVRVARAATSLDEGRR